MCTNVGIFEHFSMKHVVKLFLYSYRVIYSFQMFPSYVFYFLWFFRFGFILWVELCLIHARRPQNCSLNFQICYHCFYSTVQLSGWLVLPCRELDFIVVGRGRTESNLGLFLKWSNYQVAKRSLIGSIFFQLLVVCPRYVIHCVWFILHSSILFLFLNCVWGFLQCCW